MMESLKASLPQLLNHFTSGTSEICHLMMVSRFLPLLCCTLALLLGVAIASSPKAKPRAKRSLPAIPSKHSVDDLVLELAKKHLIKMIADQQVDLAKLQHSMDKLQMDSCTGIKSVGAPVAHNVQQYTQGSWMKDPLGIMGTETIFVMESYAGRRELQEFENMDKFKAGIIHKKHTLPYNYDGTGAVVYGPYLYYNRENSAYIIKYNLQTDKQEAQISLSGFTPRKNGYQWCGVYCAVDLAVDEQGLWALWGDTDNGYRLYAYKIDVKSNTVVQTYTLPSEKMNTMGNAFVACGVVYCIDQYNGKTTTINFAYDTKTHKHWNPNIKFTNQYGYNSMVAYNPREKVLYAWDNKRQVTYPITFEEPSK